MTDMINHPPHYTATEYEPIDIIAAIGNPYCRGNALKYLARAGRKGDAVEDLKKARWYVQRLLKTHEAFVPMARGDAALVADAWAGISPSLNTAVHGLLSGSQSLTGICSCISRVIVAAAAVVTAEAGWVP